MIVAGIGLRGAATARDLRAALALCPAAQALAVVADKADHPAFAGASLPLIAVPLADLAGMPAKTLSPAQPARYGAKSVAEAAALAAAGPGAKLIMARITGPGGLVTVALAEGHRA